jgi:hypothetical protein
MEEQIIRDIRSSAVFNTEGTENTETNGEPAGGPAASADPTTEGALLSEPPWGVAWLFELSAFVAAAVLLFALVVQTGLVAPKPRAKTALKSLQESLPGSLPGWPIEDLPVGPMEVDSTFFSK